MARMSKRNGRRSKSEGNKEEEQERGGSRELCEGKCSVGGKAGEASRKQKRKQWKSAGVKSWRRVVEEKKEESEYGSRRHGYKK